MKRETREWLSIAEEELQSGECLFERGFYRMAYYHAQQAVEKVLKALLVEKEIPPPRTHNILDLCVALRKLGSNPPLSEEESVFLTSIYQARYPAGLGLLPSGEPSKGDAEKALQCASKIWRWFQEVCRTSPPDLEKY
ncbi:MAG: HEPN domain-containing protein [Candidatus Caldatribacterium sp.]|nr:HEPN domain-containing protein [Candidatus Caldatribacterium sp.]